MTFTEKWYPRCLEAEQVLSGDYDTVHITFDLAPDDMNFDRYKVVLFETCAEKQMDCGYIYHSGTILRMDKVSVWSLWKLRL